MTAVFCCQCDKATDNPYRHGSDYYCPACWEDRQRHESRDALGAAMAPKGPGYNDSRQMKANYRRGRRP